MGRVIGNLLTFPRSYAQQLYLAAKQATTGTTMFARYRGLKRFIGLILGPMLVGSLLKILTGKKVNYYDPINMLSWSPGGLAVGAFQEGFELIPDLYRGLVWGDKQALNRALAGIPRVGSLFLPFYTQFINALEAATDTVNIDLYGLRKVRALLDKNYKPRAENYKVERSLIQKIQHALFGGAEKPEEEKEEKPTFTIKKLRGPEGPKGPKGPGG